MEHFNQVNKIVIYWLIVEELGKKGYVFGKLININHGEDYGYPAIKLEKKASKIHGMIFKADNLKKK